MESLPQDILLDILARLDTKSLLSLCLVSRPMHFVSRPLLFRSFDGYHPERSLKRLRIFSQQLQKNTYLAPQVRSIDVGYIKEPYIGELQDIFEVLLKLTPNLRHLCVPAGHFIEFLNNLLKRQNYLLELRSFETYYGPRIYKPLQCWGSVLGLRQLSSLKIRRCARWEWLSVREYDTLLTPTPPDLRSIPPEIQGRGDLLLRHITIGESNLGYTILARLIQSCKRLEAFSYQSASGWDAEDSEPTTIIQALLLHKDSLTFLGFDFRSREYHSDGEDEDFDQVPKVKALEEFSCLKQLSVPQDCLPRKPLLPPSLKVLCIESPEEPLEPDLFYQEDQGENGGDREEHYQEKNNRRQKRPVTTANFAQAFDTLTRKRPHWGDDEEQRKRLKLNASIEFGFVVRNSDGGYPF